MRREHTGLPQLRRTRNRRPWFGQGETHVQNPEFVVIRGVVRRALRWEDVREGGV